MNLTRPITPYRLNLRKYYMEKAIIQRSVLTNGIVLLSETIPHVRSVSVGVWVKTGSQDESPALNGASHFIEHLLFKGTPTRSAREIAFVIDSLGGHLDAFTGREHTCFYTRIMDEHLPLAMELLADIALNPLFDSKDIEVERQVILEEIRTTEDAPDDYIHDMFAHAIWGDNPLGQPILGTSQTIRQLTPEKLKNYFKENYFGGNIVISAAGNITHQELYTLAQKYFQVQDRSATDTSTGDNNYSQPPQSVISRNKDLEQVHLCLGTKGISYSHKYRFAIFILNTLLGGGMSSRLFQKIREERGLAYSIYSYFVSYQTTGIFSAYAATAPENMREVVELILQEFTSLKTTPVDKEELTKSKEQLKGSLMLGMESTTNRMSSLAKYEIYFGRQFTLDEIIDNIEKVTPGELQELARELFSGESLTLALMGPAEAVKFDAKSLRC